MLRKPLPFIKPEETVIEEITSPCLNPRDNTSGTGAVWYEKKSLDAGWTFKHTPIGYLTPPDMEGRYALGTIIQQVSYLHVMHCNWML